MTLGQMQRVDTEALADKLDDLGVDLLVRWGPGDERHLLFRFNGKAPIHVGALALMSEAMRLFQTNPQVRDSLAHTAVQHGLAVQDIDQPAWTARLLSPEEVAARFSRSYGEAA